MATTDFDFSVTRDSIIAAAYQKVGAIPQGATPTSAQISAAADMFNIIIKDLETDFAPLWSIASSEITLVAGTSNYVVGSDANLIGLQKAMYRTTDSSGNTTDKPLCYISWLEYQEIENKLDRDEPTDIAVEPTSKKIYLNPVPNVADKLLVVYLTKFKDYDLASSTGDMPVEATRTLIYSLAADLADDYKLGLSERAMLRDEAKKALTKFRTWASRDGDFSSVRSAY